MLHIFLDKEIENKSFYPQVVCDYFLFHLASGFFPKLDILSVAIHDCGYLTQNMALRLTLVFWIVAGINDMHMFLLIMNYVVAAMMIDRVRLPQRLLHV